jgi:hypothetical protein
MGVGFTAKIRDARLGLETLGHPNTSRNVGFVPLVNLRLEWFIVPKFSFVLDVDALVGPQGRAEDGLVAFQYYPHEYVSIKLGYRVVEGGADSSTVYTFTMIHYAVVGTTLHYDI